MNNAQLVFDEWQEKANALQGEIDAVDARLAHCDAVTRRYTRKQLESQLAGLNASYQAQLIEIEDDLRKEWQKSMEPEKPKLTWGEIRSKFIAEGLI